MKATEIVGGALEMSDYLTNTMLEDMRDEPLTQPTPRGGNHPLWVIGHLALTEGALFQMVTGERNPVEQWNDLFAGGTEPTADATRYPAFDDVLAKYRQLQAANRKQLDGMDDAALDRPQRNFGTIGKAYMSIAMHRMLHLGQVADARRVAGRKAFFTGPPEPSMA
jgi:DinB family protein